MPRYDLHEEVGQFMQNDVVEALNVFFGELQIEANCTTLWTAATPFGSHALNEELIDINAQTFLPRVYSR